MNKILNRKIASPGVFDSTPNFRESAEHSVSAVPENARRGRVNNKDKNQTLSRELNFL
jgi:hypothetical protein